MSADAYLVFLAIVVLVLSASGLAVGFVFRLPDGLKAYRYWKRQGDGPRVVYSFWSLVRTSLALLGLAAFLGVSVTILAIPDPESTVRQFLARHLLIVVVGALTALVMSEPVAERRLDGALAEAEGEHDASVASDTNERVREMQERGRADRPLEETDRLEGHEHRGDITAKLDADREERAQERADDRKERAKEREDDREERRGE